MATHKYIKIIFTSDIHGNYFPYDFRHEKRGKGGLQKVYAYVEAIRREKHEENLILVDGGDILQGEPTAYYFNNIDTEPNQHKVADMCNFIGYDVGVIGNHDIETGHKTFDRFIEACKFPVLGANAISSDTGKPYFKPYSIIVKDGVKIAFIGFITPAIPHWIPLQVWKDMHFDDIKESARMWIKKVRETEAPDLIVGLFHSGMEEGIITDEYCENAVRETATEVDGFDLILYGHDHTNNIEEITGPSNRKILCVNPGSYAYSASEIQIRLTYDKKGRIFKKKFAPKQIYIGSIHNKYTWEFDKRFKREYDKVEHFAEQEIGEIKNRIDITDAYFGSSAYIDLIHTLQKEVSHADISFAAPLFFNASIDPGTIKITNLFNLYRFEDKLYTLRLKGSEIKEYLEMSYSIWTNQMTSEDDEMLMIGPMKNNPERIGFKNFLFNFDSAFGIIYEVDLRKPTGEKINILHMSDGTPFEPEHTYTVAMTAYRANGGGELLTKGAGLSKEEIQNRIITSTEKDIRFYLMEYVKRNKVIAPEAQHHWKFIPEDWAAKAEKRERKILFENYRNDKKDDRVQ